MNSAAAKRITSKSPTYEREITSHITPGLLLGTLNMEMTDLTGPGEEATKPRRNGNVVSGHQ
jgi:hypothetical protein